MIEFKMAIINERHVNAIFNNFFTLIFSIYFLIYAAFLFRIKQLRTTATMTEQKNFRSTYLLFTYQYSWRAKSVAPERCEHLPSPK